MEFNPTMKEFCQMIKEAHGKMVGMNLNGSFDGVIDSIKSLGYYKDERPIIEPWATSGNIFQIDDQFLIVLREDFSIRAILRMYEIKKWVVQDGVIAISGHDQVMIYDIENMKMTLK